MIQRRYYNLEKLAAPPKPLTPREEAELRQQKEQAARREQEVRSGTDTLGQYRRRQSLERLWDEQTKYNPNMKGRDDLKAQYVDSYMNNPDQMTNDGIAKNTDQARKKNYADGHVEHAYLGGDWAPENTSRAMQLFGSSKMNDKGELEEVPLGKDIYGNDVGPGERLVQNILRPMDTLTDVMTKIPSKLKEVDNKYKDYDAKRQDRDRYNRMVERGEIPRPDNYDPETSFENSDEPEAYNSRLELAQERSEEEQSRKADQKAYVMANKKRVAEEVKGNKNNPDAAEAEEYYKNPDLTFKQRNIIPFIERASDDVVTSSKAIGLDKLDKLEKTHPWVAKARGLSGPALKSLAAVAAVTNPEIIPLLTEVISGVEAVDASASVVQAAGKAGKSIQDQVAKGEKGDADSAALAGLLSTVAKVPNVKVTNGKVDIGNVEKSLVSKIPALQSIADVSKNVAKDTGELVKGVAGKVTTDAATQTAFGEVAKNVTSGVISASGNPLAPATKPLGTTSAVFKPPKTPVVTNYTDSYNAMKQKVDDLRLARNGQQPAQNQQVQAGGPTNQSMPDEQPMQSEQPNYGGQMDSTFDVPYSSPAQGNQLYSQEPAAPMQQQQAVNPQVPKQPQAVNPQVPKQLQAVNQQVPKQPQAAKVNITPPKQGTQVASVTPATKGYKIQ